MTRSNNHKRIEKMETSACTATRICSVIQELNPKCPASKK
jgi:hypothetical protein